MNIIIPGLSALIICTLILLDIIKNGYKVVLNPFFWMLLLCFFYIVLPSFFVSEINYYFSWGIDSSSIYISHFIALLSILVLSSFYYFNFSSFYAKSFSDDGYSISPLLKILWWFIFIYLIVVLYLSIKDFNVVDAFVYKHSQRDPFKIKNIGYVLLCLSTLYFFSEKKYWIFLPNLIVALLDLLNGSRTTALIALMPIVICLCIHRKTLFIVPGSMLLAGMLLLGVVRSDNVVGGVPWYLNAIGEFRETYITLPLMINNEHYIGVGSIWDASAGAGVGLLQPLRADLLAQFSFAGSYIAKLVGRGYGLGSNFIIEPFFYGYIFFFIMLAFLCLLLVVFKIFIFKSKLQISLVLACYAVIFIRIMVREGVPISVGLFSFVFLFYAIPLFFMDKVKSFFLVK